MSEHWADGIKSLNSQCTKYVKPKNNATKKENSRHHVGYNDLAFNKLKDVYKSS